MLDVTSTATLVADIVVDFKGIPIVLEEGTVVTLLKKETKGYTVEALVTKDTQVIRIVFTAFKKELKELKSHENDKSRTLSKPVYGDTLVQE